MYCYSALERFAGYDKTQTWRLASSFYHIWLRSYVLLNIPRPCSPIQLQIIPDVIASLDFRQEWLEKIITPQSVDIGKRFWTLNLRHSMIYKTLYGCLTVLEATSELKIIESQPYFRCRSGYGGEQGIMQKCFFSTPPSKAMHNKKSMSSAPSIYGRSVMTGRQTTRHIHTTETDALKERPQWHIPSVPLW